MKIFIGLMFLMLLGNPAQAQTSNPAQKYIDENVKTGKIASIDLYGVWNYLTSGKFPFSTAEEQSEYGIKNYDEWKQKVVKISADFTAYDLYGKTCCSIKSNDLLVYQFPGRREGGAIAVYQYKADLEIDAEVYQEFDKSTFREANFPLSLYPKDEAERPIRPGLYGLRFKEKKTK